MSNRSKVVTTLVLLAGCGSGDGVRLEDDLHPDTGRRSADADGDVLHGPYATGARFGLRVEGVDDEDCWKMEVVSDDTAILDVVRDDEDECRTLASALGPGRTTLRVKDREDEVHAVGVEVATPVRATIHPRALLGAGIPEGAASWERAKVVLGATASFTVRWWDEESRELGAHEVLVPTAPEELRLGAAEGHPPNVDALQVTPRMAGSYTAEVGTASERLGSIEIDVVDPADVTGLALLSGEVPGDDERRVILAVARDGGGDRVLGLQPTWTAGGVEILDDEGEVKEGDLFLFGDGGSETSVVATIDGHEAATTVSLSGTPSVESSNGCQGVPGIPAPAGAFLLAAGAIVARVTRRLRRQ